MGQNLFEIKMSCQLKQLPDLSQEDNLDDYIQEICLSNRLASEFNPWRHRLINWSVAKCSFKLPTAKYEAVYDGEYRGPERRSKMRTYADEKFFQIKNELIINMMTKTQKIIELDKAG